VLAVVVATAVVAVVVAGVVTSAVVVATVAPAVVITRLGVIAVMAVVMAGRIVGTMTGLGNRSAAQRQRNGGAHGGKLGVDSVLHLVSLTWGRTTRWRRGSRGLNWT
jgi:hypothetical protein